jgi:hypothetical protein
VRGTRRKVADNDLSSDSEDKSPHLRTGTSTRKVIYGLGGRGKAAAEKYSLQVLLSFRCLQVNKTDWGSEVVVPALRRGNRKKPERNYVVSFPAITDAEHGEDDGRVPLPLERGSCR